MQLRSGATICREAPEGTPPRSNQAVPDEGIPEQTQIASPLRQEDDVDVPITGVPVPRTPAHASQVYTAGTYVVSFILIPRLRPCNGR
jgi:hypothetical protein